MEIIRILFKIDDFLYSYDLPMSVDMDQGIVYIFDIKNLGLVFN